MFCSFFTLLSLTLTGSYLCISQNFNLNNWMILDAPQFFNVPKLVLSTIRLPYQSQPLEVLQL